MVVYFLFNTNPSTKEMKMQYIHPPIFKEGKACSKCKGNGPFNRSKDRKDGLNCICVKCLKAYRIKNRERIKEYMKNRDKTKKREADRVYRTKHKVRLNKYSNDYYKAHKKTMRQYQKDHSKYQEQTARKRAKIHGIEGSFTQRQWENLKSHHNFTCLACGKKEPDIKLTVDHVVPLCFKGLNDISNIQPLCLACNSAKRRQKTDFR